MKAGQRLAEWDPYTIPILTEVAGVVKFGDLIEGVTIEERLDERTGLSNTVVIDYTSTLGRRSPRREARRSAAPRRRRRRRRSRRRASRSRARTARRVKLPSGQEARYQLPVGIHLNVVDGQEVAAGDVLAKMPRETTKTKDITGGLPRVAELFEARKPKEFAVVSEIDGIVSFGKDTKGKRKIEVTPEVGEPREYLIPKGKHIRVHEGDHVRAGDAAHGRLDQPARHPHHHGREGAGQVPGRRDPGDLPAAGRAHQRQAHRGHRPPDAAPRPHHRDRATPSSWSATRSRSGASRRRTSASRTSGGEPATAEPLLLGITKASLSTESFISAASFQETTKVLTEAAINGKVDRLVGLKENVIMGRLIPAGTGVPRYNRIEVEVHEPEPGSLPDEEQGLVGDSRRQRSLDSRPVVP